MNNLKVLLMGAGDIASRLQPLLAVQGYEVTGARRNPPATANYPQLQADAREANDWQQILTARPDVIVLTMVPTEFSDIGYQQGYVEPVQAMLGSLTTVPDYQPFIVFVSSSSVYSEREGGWISERSPTNPDSFSGQRLEEAENLLKTSNYQHVVVRFSGIYGPGREGMLKRLKAGQLTVTPAWTNRIHVRDCAGVLAHLIGQYRLGKPLHNLYLASDNLPVRQSDFVRGLATKFGIDASVLPRSEDVGPRGSKRCDNTRLRETGYTFVYPTWHEGYAELDASLEKTEH